MVRVTRVLRTLKVAVAIGFDGPFPCLDENDGGEELSRGALRDRDIFIPEEGMWMV